jgi:hypothetical protein
VPHQVEIMDAQLTAFLPAQPRAVTKTRKVKVPRLLMVPLFPFLRAANGELLNDPTGAGMVGYEWMSLATTAWILSA